MENSIKNKTIKSLKKIIFLFFAIGTILIFAVTIYYNLELEKQITERDNLINQLTFSDNLVKEYFDIKYDSVKGTTSYILKETKSKVKTIETQTTITETDTLLTDDYNKLVGKYNNLVGEFHDISSNYFNIKDSLETDKAIIRLIQKKYPIDIFIENELLQRTISIKSEKLDSALLLLPHYRDKIKYDSKEKSWIITLPPK